MFWPHLKSFVAMTPKDIPFKEIKKMNQNWFSQ